MKEGFWLNYATAREFEIDEHELWLRRSGNAQLLGIPAEVAARFSDFAPVLHRDRFLTFVISRAPVVRVRGHGVSVSFEFATTDELEFALRAILRFCDRNAGPRTWVRISNLATQTTLQIPFEDFAERHGRGEIAALLGTAPVAELP